MKCIFPDLVVSVSADTENSEYPATNVLDRVPSLPYQALDKAGTLTLNVAGGAEAVGLAGLNGVAVNIKVKDSSSQIVAETDIDLVGIDTYYKFFTQRVKPRTRVGFVYPYQSDAHQVIVTIDTGNDEIMAECGVGGAGPLYRWRESTSLSFGLVDYSVKDRYSSGGKYYLKRDIVHKYSGKVRLDLNPDLFVWLDDLAQEIGEEPTFWWLTDQKNINHFTFAGFYEMPSASSDNRYGYATWSFLEEV